MSREPKRMEENVRGSGKLILYISIAVAVVMAIVAYAIVSNNMQERNEAERLAEIENQEKIAEQESLVIDLGSTEEGNTESVSTQIGKTVEEKEKENENEEKSTEKKETSVNKDEKSTTQNKETSASKSENIIQNKESKTKENTTEETSSKNTDKTVKNETKTEEESKKEITFAMPVEGEIVRGFAKDSLVYSETLQEWIVHQAIDIKANSRDVVKASAEGTVTAIKNDPRYGLTVIIEHTSGFKTVYSNLLTAEFVVEGEQVKQGQTIGTVGGSATFEIADEPHLHFEMLKDSVYVDPSIYIKY